MIKVKYYRVKDWTNLEISKSLSGVDNTDVNTYIVARTLHAKMLAS
jgi:hypothetical protein